MGDVWVSDRNTAPDSREWAVLRALTLVVVTTSGLMACADQTGPQRVNVAPSPVPMPGVEGEGSAGAEAPGAGATTAQLDEAEPQFEVSASDEDVEPPPELASVCPVWEEGTRMALSETTPRRLGDVAALTFDDGPHPTQTPLILDILAKEGISGTFFVTGRSINARTYGLLQRMVKEGHSLANHGYFHDHGLVRRRDEVGRSMIGRNFLVNQAIVDAALLARSPEDFKALYARLFGLPCPRYPKDVLLRKWPALLKGWAEILKERSGGRSPLTMVFVRLPGGAPYIGRHWGGNAIRMTDRELARLGFVHVLWHAGIGDADPWRTGADLRDTRRLGDTLAKVLTRGGIITLHDRAPVAHLSRVLPEVKDKVEFVGMEHYLARAFECDALQARASLWLHYADAFDGSLCPWFCGERAESPGSSPESSTPLGGTSGLEPVKPGAGEPGTGEPGE